MSSLIGKILEAVLFDMDKFIVILTRSILSIPVVLLVLLIRSLKPFVIVRFCKIDIGRIGGVLLIDWYLAERQAGKHKHTYDIFYASTSTGSISNKEWLKIWKRSCHISTMYRLFELTVKFNQKFPGWEAHVISIPDAVPAHNEPYTGAETSRCILNYLNPSIAFTAKEEVRGRKVLNEILPENRPFVCFHARDSAYLKTFSVKKNWSYHDFRDSDINNYLLAAEKLAERGYYALRMGSVAEKKISSSDARVIDYAMSPKRGEFLDIYLGAKCNFFICSDTGMSIIPEMFRRPIVFVNWVPLLRLPWFYVLKGLIIPKKFYLRKEKRFLSFKEILTSEIGSASRGEIFEKLNIELIENTPEEILAVTFEMEERLKGTWKTTEEDEILQQKFWKLFDVYQFKNPGVRIGADFLRNHKSLLGEVDNELIETLQKR